jgi:dCMP deaminase
MDQPDLQVVPARGGRPSWDDFFLGLAEYASRMATCPRLSVGACLVRGKHVLSLGFNGAPSGHPHCTEVGCLVVDGACLRARHAEANAIMQAVERRIDLRGAVAYLTHSPCEDCARSLVREGIGRVVFRHLYRRQEALRLLAGAGVEVVRRPAPAAEGGPGAHAAREAAAAAEAE